MKFMQQEKVKKIRGDPRLSKTLISPQAWMKMTEIKAFSMFWVMESELAESMRLNQVQCDMLERGAITIKVNSG